MASLLDSLADYLDAGSTKLTVGTNLFVGDLPDTATITVALLDSGGAAEVRNHSQATAAFLRPGFQVLIRSTAPANGALAINPVAAKTIATEVYHRISRLGDQNIPTSTGSVRIVATEMLQSPYFIDRDEAGRSLFGFNVACWIPDSTNAT